MNTHTIQQHKTATITWQDMTQWHFDTGRKVTVWLIARSNCFFGMCLANVFGNCILGVVFFIYVEGGINTAILKLKLFPQENITLCPSLYRDCTIIFEWAHFTCCALWTFPCSWVHCPDRTLCSSIKVQNNTSMFQCWKGQWQLQSSARWLCILINQQGGSRLCLPPHAVWSGAWRLLARPLLSPLW